LQYAARQARGRKAAAGGGPTSSAPLSLDTRRMPNRARSFWQRISDGVTLQQLWSQLSVEARASYRLYSAEVDWARLRDEKRSRRAQRVISGLFWAMVMKLSPARRVV